MDWIIDRIENGTALCEAGDAIISVSVSALPDGINEGDVISLYINTDKTKKRKDNISRLMDKLFTD